MKKKTAITGAVLLVITGILLVCTFLFSWVGDEALPDNLEFEVHETVQKLSTKEHYAEISQEFLDAGTTITDFWEDHDTKNAPTINSTSKGIITTKKTITNCPNYVCDEVEWILEPTDEVVTTIKFLGKNIVEQIHYIEEDVEVGWYNNVTKVFDSIIQKQYKLYTPRTIPANKKTKMKTKVRINGSGEYDISAGNLYLDPMFNYTQMTRFFDYFNDSFYNTTMWTNHSDRTTGDIHEDDGYLNYSVTGSDKRRVILTNFDIRSMYRDAGITNVSVQYWFNGTCGGGANTCGDRVSIGSQYYPETISNDCGGQPTSNVACNTTINLVAGNHPSGAPNLILEQRINFTFDLKNMLVYCETNQFALDVGIADYAVGCQNQTSATASLGATGLQSSVINISSMHDYSLRLFSTHANQNEVKLMYVNIESENKIPSTPVWNKPDNDSVMFSNQYFLNWTNSTDENGDSLTYNLEIDNNSDFSSPEQVNVSIVETETPTNYFVSGLLGGTWYSRVRANDGAINSSWSSILTWLQATVIVVEGEKPGEGEAFSSSNVTFNCTSNSSLNVETVELWIDGSWNYSKIEGTTNVTSFEIGRVLTDGSHNYSCIANNTEEYASSSNKTFTVESSFPVISFSTPGTNNLLKLNRNITMTWSIVNTSALSTCWYRFENVNNTFDCATTSVNLTNLPAAVASYNVTIHANTSLNLEGVKSNNFSVVAFSEAFLFNASAPETSLESLNYNATADGGASISANLVWDGTSYSSTNNGNTTHGEFTRSLVMPTGSPGVKNFHWELTYGSDTFQTQTRSQNVTNTVLCECSESGCNGSPYLNFTFKDEGTASILDGSIASTSWDFFIKGSGGTVIESFFYSQSTERPSFAFCFEPSDELYTVDYVTQYEKIGYAQRRAGLTGLTLTNATTNTVLYLLNNSLGSYVTIQAQNPYGTPLSGVDIKANKLINNTLTLIEQDISGGDGGVTFWLNTNDDHTFVLVKSSYASVTSTFRPTQSLYIITMNPSSANGSFQSDVEGIDYTFAPKAGRLDRNTNYTFSLNVTSYRSLYANLSELTNCTIRIYLANGSTLATVGGCSSGGDNITLSFNTSSYEDFKGAIGFAFGGEMVWVDQDFRWFTMFSYTVKPRGTINSFFTYATNIPELGNETKRQQFSRLTLFFFILMITLGMLSMKTGWDLATGGGGLFAVALITFIASYGGFLYMAVTPLEFINKYLLGLMALFFSIGWTIRGMRP